MRALIRFFLWSLSLSAQQPAEANKPALGIRCMLFYVLI